MRFAQGRRPSNVKAVVPKSEEHGTRMHPVFDIAKQAAIVPSQAENNSSRVIPALEPSKHEKEHKKKDSLPPPETTSMTPVPAKYNSMPDLGTINLFEEDISSPNDIVVGTRIGNGAFGDVFECTIKGSDKLFALKVQPGDENLLEADLLKKYRHPNIVPIIAYFKVATMGQPKPFKHYLVMEKFTTSLGKEISKREMESRIFKKKEVQLILESISQGISFLHNQKKPIMHRDIKVEISLNFLSFKSDNILLMMDENGKITRAALTDFGVSRETEKGRFHQTIAGTPAYWAPEMFHSHYTAMCDSN